MVSTFGRFIAKELSAKSNSLHRVRTLKAHLLKPALAPGGYLKVTLSGKGKPKTLSAHRLVAKTFIPNPDNKPTIDHIDRNRKNNTISNLRWCTLSENMHNPLTQKHCSNLNKGRQKPKRYKPVVAIKDGIVHKIYPSIKQAISEGFSGCQISNVCAGRGKIHRGFNWMFLSDYESLISMSKNFLPNRLSSSRS